TMAPDVITNGRDDRLPTGGFVKQVELPRDTESVANSSQAAPSASAISPSITAPLARQSLPLVERLPGLPSLARIVSSVYLAGCLLSGLQLMGAALVLRRRLSVCRPVTDVAVLSELESARVRFGLK